MAEYETVYGLLQLATDLRVYARHDDGCLWEPAYSDDQGDSVITVPCTCGFDQVLDRYEEFTGDR